MQYEQDTIARILRECVDGDATDVHFKVPGRPRMRIHGALVDTQFPPLTPRDTLRVAQALLGFAHTELPLATIQEHELSFGVKGMGRFRAHMYRQRGTLSIVVHRMVLRPPTLASLGCEPSLGAAVWDRPGLCIVLGESMRMATLAALIDHYNTHSKGFLVSLEHPLEFLHADKKALVAQREVGQDTDTFEDGLTWALTSDVDALVSADLPGAASAELALRAAEAGQRVVVGLVGCPPQEAIAWFTRLFEKDRRAEVHARLRKVLRLLIFERKGEVKVAPGERLFQSAKAS